MLTKFTRSISADVQAELILACQARNQGDASSEFRHLENAHVLGQASTYWHVKVHVLMLRWAVRNSALAELWGQIIRVVGAATKTPFGLIPKGNTGGSNVSPFKTMPIRPEHEQLIRNAMTRE